jgi:hypothetical protein
MAQANGPGVPLSDVTQRSWPGYRPDMASVIKTVSFDS